MIFKVERIFFTLETIYISPAEGDFLESSSKSPSKSSSKSSSEENISESSRENPSRENPSRENPSGEGSFEEGSEKKFLSQIHHLIVGYMKNDLKKYHLSKRWKEGGKFPLTPIYKVLYKKEQGNSQEPIGEPIGEPIWTPMWELLYEYSFIPESTQSTHSIGYPPYSFSSYEQWYHGRRIQGMRESLSEGISDELSNELSKELSKEAFMKRKKVMFFPL